MPYGSDEVNDADYDLEDAEDDGNCNSGGSSSKSTQKKKKETKKNQRDAYRYHSSLSQQPVNNELNGRETRRIRAAAEMCKSKAISLENPITLQPKKGARGAGGSMIGDGKQALPGGYEYGDVVYSKIFFSFKGQSIAPGDKGVITGPCMSKSVTAKDRVRYVLYLTKCVMPSRAKAYRRHLAVEGTQLHVPLPFACSRPC